MLMYDYQWNERKTVLDVVKLFGNTQVFIHRNGIEYNVLPEVIGKRRCYCYIRSETCKVEFKQTFIFSRLNSSIHVCLNWLTCIRELLLSSTCNALAATCVRIPAGNYLFSAHLYSHRLWKTRVSVLPPEQCEFTKCKLFRLLAFYLPLLTVFGFYFNVLHCLK